MEERKWKDMIKDEDHIDILAKDIEEGIESAFERKMSHILIIKVLGSSFISACDVSGYSKEVSMKYLSDLYDEFYRWRNRP